MTDSAMTDTAKNGPLEISWFSALCDSGKSREANFGGAQISLK